MTISFQAGPREVLEDVVADPQFHALTVIPRIAPMEIGLVIAAFTLFGASSYLYLAGELPLVVMLLVNAIAVYMAFTPLHDATHRTVSSHRPLNDLIGTVSCLLLLPGITTRIYRYLHLEHHRYAGDRVKDPDEPFVSSGPLQAVFVTAGLDVLWTRWYLKQWDQRPVGERIEFCCAIGFYVGVHVVFLSSPYAFEFFILWMVPQRLGLFLVAWFFARIQHPRDVLWEEAPFQTTVRIICSRIGGWLMLGQARHCLHHLAPSIPYYRYHRAWEIGRERFETQDIPTRTFWTPVDDIKLPSSEARHGETREADRPFEVEIASTGEVITVGADQFLIDALHDAGHYVMCSCTQGICGSCMTPVLEGEPDHRDFIMSDEEHSANDCMTVCVSRAKSDRLVLDL